MRIQGSNFGMRSAFRYQIHNKIYKVSDHIHQYAEIIVMLEGRMRITVDGNTEYLEAGDAAVILPFQRHGMSSKEVNKLAMYLFSPSVVSDILMAYDGKVGEGAKFKPTEATVKVFSEHICEKEDLPHYRVKAFLYMILSDYLDQIPLKESLGGTNVVSKVLTYMYEHYTEQISLEDVAAAIGYSANYLSHCIQKLYGLNFCAALASLRVEKARNLVATTGKSNTEICYECGFGSERSFIRRFKEIMGFTPSDYRKHYYTGPFEEAKTKYFD